MRKEYPSVLNDLRNGDDGDAGVDDFDGDVVDACFGVGCDVLQNFRTQYYAAGDEGKRTMLRRARIPACSTILSRLLPPLMSYHPTMPRCTLGRRRNSAGPPGG